MVSLGSIAGAGSGSVVSIVIRGVDEFSGKLDEARNSVSKINKKLLAAGAGMTAAGIAGAGAIGRLASKAGEGVGIANSFNNMFGDEAPSALERLREATQGTVSDIELMRQANNALLLGIDQEALPNMFEGAMSAAQATGRPVADAIGDITTGIGRQSRLILDNLGIIVSQEKANEELAQSLGKTTSELTDAERKQAFMNATMEALNDNMQRIGEVTNTAAIETQKANAQWDNATQKLGESLAPAVSAVASGLASVAEWFSNLSPTMQKIVGTTAAVTTGLLLIAGPITSLIALFPMITAGLGAMATGLTAVTIAGFPLWAIILAIIAAVAAVVAVIKNWDKISAFLKRTWEKIVDFFKSKVMPIFNRVFSFISEGFDLLKNGVKLLATQFQMAWNFIKLGLAKVANFIIDSFEKVLNSGVAVINGLIKAANNIPGVEIGMVGKVQFDSAKFNTAAIEGRISELDKQQMQLTRDIIVNVENLSGLDAGEVSRALQRQLDKYLPPT